jgi:hypothetical protein
MGQETQENTKEFHIVLMAAIRVHQREYRLRRICTSYFSIFRGGRFMLQSTHRVAMATFWHIFHHEYL